MIKSRKNVYTNPSDDIFTKIKRQLQSQAEYCKRTERPEFRTLIFVDDMGGNKSIHGGRFGAFSELAVMCNHSNISIIAVAHQLTMIAPAFRHNLHCLVMFPSTREADVKLLCEEYKPLRWTKKQMRECILAAWEGDGQKIDDDDDVEGDHFFVILQMPREKTRFYIDFEWEIRPNAEG